MQEKRLFFGLEVEAPWPLEPLKGRLIPETDRHMTLAFLGEVDWENLGEKLIGFPVPEIMGPVGVTKDLLDNPRILSFVVEWLNGKEAIESLHRALNAYLKTLGFEPDPRPFLPHVTVARAPFDKPKTFEPLPILIKGLHLYESIGNLNYPSLWQRPFILPFEEFEHTADIAFHIRGKSLEELYLHASVALSFRFPPLLSYLQKRKMGSQLDVIETLSQMIAAADQEIGCPFKAVSYHGKCEKKQTLWHWEMIVDV